MPPLVGGGRCGDRPLSLRPETFLGNDKTKFSYGVLRQLNEIGYEIVPVNPNPAVTEIRGLTVLRSLEEIDQPVDMVDVFRPKEELYGIAEQAIAIGAKVLWAKSASTTTRRRSWPRPPGFRS